MLICLNTIQTKIKFHILHTTVILDLPYSDSHSSESLLMDVDLARFLPEDVSRARSWPKVSLENAEHFYIRMMTTKMIMTTRMVTRMMMRTLMIMTTKMMVMIIMTMTMMADGSNDDDNNNSDQHSKVNVCI